MATEKIGVEIDINTNDLDKLKIGLEAAEKEANKLKEKFGESSKEFKDASELVEKFKKRVADVGAQSEKGIGNLKKQLKAANLELINAQANFGDYSNEATIAAKKVAQLKDQIQEAGEYASLFDPGKKFQVFAGALSSVAGGFSAVQGALALVGVESDNVQKSLLKAQSALALSQGLSTIADSAKDFERLKAIVGTGLVNAFKSLRAAIGATGIGLLVVALASVVAYWEDIKTAITGVSGEQKKLTEDSKNNLTSEKEKLDIIDEQDNILKAQGKSEKEILGIKIAQTDEVIKAQEILLENEKTNKKIAVEIAERNKKYLKGFLDFVTLPPRKLYELAANSINSLIELINKIPGVNIEARLNGKLLDEVNEGIANYIFDPKEAAKEGDATIKEAEKSLRELKNKKAGYENSIKDINKKAAEEAAQKRKERDQAEIEAQKRLFEAKKEAELAAIKDEFDRRNKEIQFQRAAELKDLELNTKISEETRNQLKDAIYEKYLALEKKNEEDRAKSIKEKRDKELEKIKEFETKANEVKAAIRVDGIKNEGDRELEAITQRYNQERDAILAQKDLTAEQILARDALLAEMQIKYEQDKKLKIDEIKKKDLEKTVTKLEEKVNDPELEIKKREDALKAEDELIKKSFEDRIITEEEYLEKRKKIADAEKKLEEEKLKQQLAAADAISSTLGNIANLFGKNTRAGKVFAIAEATMNTFTSAVKAYNATVGIPVVGPVLAPINAGLAIAAGVKNIKEIQKVKIPGGDGGSANIPSVSATAPIAPPVPQVTTTKLDNQTINKIGQASRSYVLESDITDSQERQKRINRAARLS